jgi:hypothetical protein
MNLHPAHPIRQQPNRGHNARERAPRPATPPPVMPTTWPPRSGRISREEIDEALGRRNQSER